MSSSSLLSQSSESPSGTPSTSSPAAGSADGLGTQTTPSDSPLETPPGRPNTGTTMPDPLNPSGAPSDRPQEQPDPLQREPLTPRPTTPDNAAPDAPQPDTPNQSGIQGPGTTAQDIPSPSPTPFPAPSPSPSPEPIDRPTPTPSDRVPGTPERDRTPPGVVTPDTSGVSPGRATRSGPSYVGVGGNIGLGEGDTALGEGSFAVFSKVGLTSNISARPTVLFSDDPTILLPVTLDLIPLVTEVTENLSGELGLRISPFVGAGVAISTGNDGAVDFLVSGGVDIPFSRRFTGTATVNATFFDNTAIGLLLGVGYNF